MEDILDEKNRWYSGHESSLGLKSNLLVAADEQVVSPLWEVLVIHT